LTCFRASRQAAFAIMQSRKWLPQLEAAKRLLKKHITGCRCIT
jgi:hypothetical protein